MKFTVLGAGGFVGSHLAQSLREAGREVFAPARDELPCAGTPLGHVINCVGLTADFRTRPFDTVRAHVTVLSEVLERATFDSLLYLSSTRVYARSEAGREDVPVAADVTDPSDLYNLSKMMGESLCLGSGLPATVRVARLSNVYGADFRSENFLSTLIADAVEHGSVTLRTSAQSAKDYVALDDVVRLLPRIATEGRARLYNVASGIDVTNAALARALGEAASCRVEIEAGAPTVRFPTVDNGRVREEFGFRPASVLEDLPKLVQQYREHKKC